MTDEALGYCLQTFSANHMRHRVVINDTRVVPYVTVTKRHERRTLLGPGFYKNLGKGIGTNLIRR